MILAGDIGGTKTVLALFEKTRRGVAVREKRQFPSREYGSFAEVVGAFLSACGDVSIDAACFGIAGPVIDGKCRTTNLAWDITESDLQKQLETQRVKLLNDLEATAYGMLYLDEEAFVSLNPYGRKQQGNRAVIAAGTGLGEAFLFWDGAHFHPSASEGGHCDFAPTTAQQDQMLKWLRSRFKGHVSYERLLSGPGIYTIYEYLRESGFAPESPWMQEVAKSDDKSAMISQYALEYHNPLCVEALRLFCQIYGQEAGNLALKALSLGGLYIGGGIAPKILPMMQEPHFLDAFFAKGRFEEMLRSMEVKISTDPETALLGAAHYAADKL